MQERFDVEQALREMMRLHSIMEPMLEKMCASHAQWEAYYPAFKILLEENATLHKVIVVHTGRVPQWEGNSCTLGGKA
jgi:hypothetical protein